MGIKNIHIVLISASVLLCIFFGLWLLNNAYPLGACSTFLVAIALILYGVSFVKKAKKL